MAEGPFPTTSFDIQGGKPGCETQTLSSIRKTKIQPTWMEMQNKRFHVIFDMPEDIPFVARKDQEFTVVYLYDKWFALKPGTEVMHVYAGCSAANASSDSKKICIHNVLLTYDEKSGFLNVQPEDFKLSKAINSGLPDWLSGATVAIAEVFSLLEYASRKQFKGVSIAVPCSVRWINSHRINPTQKHTCIHFSAATEGDIFVIFSAIPKEKSTWYYLYMSPKGVAFYKGMILQKPDYGYGLGTLGDKNLFESYFVCLIQSGKQIGIQYGKADPDSEVGKVYAAFDFPEGKTKPSLSFYSFGVGNKPVSFNDVRLTKKLPRINCTGNDYIKVDGRCKLICHEECLKCRKAKSHQHCVECKNMKLSDIEGNVHCLKECPVGYSPHQLTDKKLCSKCGIGTFKNETGNHLCEKCPSGHFADSVGLTICKKCPIGHYTDKTGQSLCVKCRAGTKAPTTGLSSCITCPLGTTSAEGSSSCDNNCKIGRYSPHKKIRCMKCPAGQFTATTGNTKCDKCKRGTYQPKRGQSGCLDAPAGFYVESDGSKQIKPCPHGRFSNKTRSLICIACNKGTYQPEEGQSVCLHAPAGYYVNSIEAYKVEPCSTGHFSSITGSPECELCGKGTYQPHRGKSSCLDAPPGTYVSTEGSIGYRNCEKGWFTSKSKQTSCQKCPLGEYAPNTGSKHCTKCPLGEYTPNTGSKNCTKCPLGKYTPNTGSKNCTKCPLGEYAPRTGSKHCTKCPSGEFSSSYGASVCKRCPTESYTEYQEGYAKCVDKCKPGFSPDDDSWKCYTKRLTDKPISFHAAIELCKQKGGRLPELRNEADFRYFENMVLTTPPGNYWLNAYIKHFNGFVLFWISDNAKILKTNWLQDFYDALLTFGNFETHDIYMSCTKSDKCKWTFARNASCHVICQSDFQATNPSFLLPGSQIASAFGVSG